MVSHTFETFESQNVNAKMTAARRNALQFETQDVLDAIRKIVKSIRQASKSSEKKIGLSAAQLFVLQKIAESDRPLRINDLAEKTLTHQSSVSVVVAKLAKQKLVERLKSKEDARAAEVRLTSKGAEILRGRSPLIQERLVTGISRLSAVERRGLVKGLQALLEKSGINEEQPSLFFEDEE